MDHRVFKRVVKTESNERGIIRLVKFLSATAADIAEIFSIIGAWTDGSAIK
jgi:hypothetical protein